MKHVRKFLALTLVLVLALGIVGCAAPAAPDTSDAQAPAEQTTDESKPIKLTLWSCNDMIRPNELKEGQETWYISQAIERFRELYPNVTIEINAYNDNAQLMNDFKAATRAGYGPDIACFVNGPALISLKDGLLPLNDYLDDDLRTKVVGWETCAEGMNADNTIYGMPYLGQSVACFAYNKSLVKQAGLDFEANPPRTIDEFYAALDAIRDAGIQPLHLDESYPGLLLYCLSMWWEQLSGLDGILAHTDEQVSFADDEGFKFMMNEYKKFYDNGWLNKDTATSTDNYNVFLQGGSALHTLYFGDYETYHEALGDDFGMLPVPTADESLIDTDTAVGGVGAWRVQLQRKSRHGGRVCKVPAFARRNGLYVYQEYRHTDPHGYHRRGYWQDGRSLFCAGGRDGRRPLLLAGQLPECRCGKHLLLSAVPGPGRQHVAGRVDTGNGRRTA